MSDSMPRPGLKYEDLSTLGTRVTTVDPAVGFQPGHCWRQGFVDGEPDGEIDDWLGQEAWNRRRPDDFDVGSDAVKGANKAVLHVYASG